MILWDVNLWVHAFRQESPLHETARFDMESSFHSAEPFIFCPNIAVSFLRLVTNPRIFVQPSTSIEAWAFIDAFSSQPSARESSIDAMTMGIFKHITLINRTSGNTIPDDLLAALAIRHDAVLHTADRGFARYEGIRLEFIS